MTEEVERIGNSAADKEPTSLREAWAPRARLRYEPPTVVRTRLDNMVRGSTGGNTDVARPGHFG